MILISFTQTTDGSIRITVQIMITLNPIYPCIISVHPIDLYVVLINDYYNKYYMLRYICYHSYLNI